MMRKPNVHWSDLHHHQDARYLDLLRASVESLKLAMPELPVTVFSQFPIAEAAHFDKVVTVQGTSDGFYDKARLMLESPCERTLFIDADISVTKAFSEVFTLLDRFDCAATHEEYVTTDWFNNYPRLDIPASFPEFNTGILAYRHSDAMRSTLRRWSELYQQYLETTQAGR